MYNQQALLDCYPADLLFHHLNGYISNHSGNSFKYVCKNLHFPEHLRTVEHMFLNIVLSRGAFMYFLKCWLETFTALKKPVFNK